jgi:hypothetical protein
MALHFTLCWFVFLRFYDQKKILRLTVSILINVFTITVCCSPLNFTIKMSFLTSQTLIDLFTLVCHRLVVDVRTKSFIFSAPYEARGRSEASSGVSGGMVPQERRPYKGPISGSTGLNAHLATYEGPSEASYGGSGGSGPPGKEAHRMARSEPTLGELPILRL